jgi:hypothetical protein
MQTNKQQTASFPYLSIDVNDYKQTKFDLKIVRGVNNSQICFEATYSIDNLEINQLILAKKLSVVINLHCQPVGLNITKKVPLDAKNTKFLVGKMDVEKSVEFTAHLIAEESFLYSNPDLTKEWAGEEYWVEKYNDIGTSIKVIIPLEHRKEGKKSSIFQFQEKTSLDTLSPAIYKLNDDVIYFIVSRQVKKLYDKVQNRKSEVILTAFIIPALTDILRQMRESPDSQEMNEFNYQYEDKKWYKVITEKYKQIIKQDPTESDVEPYVAAQMLAKTPINNLLAFTKSWVNKMEDTD